MNCNGFLVLTSVSSGNGASQYFGYDAYARPSTTNSADGAQTAYSYSTSPAFSTTGINGRWSKTYYDGVGRPVKVESGDAGGVKSTVETEYEPCACSPMGKMKRVSLPYAPGGTGMWTAFHEAASSVKRKCHFWYGFFAPSPPYKCSCTGRGGGPGRAGSARRQGSLDGRSRFVRFEYFEAEEPDVHDCFIPPFSLGCLVWLSAALKIRRED